MKHTVLYDSDYEPDPMTTYQRPRPVLTFPLVAAIARDLAIVLAAVVYAIDQL